MSMHDLKRALKVDENSSIGTSSLAAATSSVASTVSWFGTPMLQVGVVVARWSAEFVDITRLISSISRWKVLWQVDGCSMEGLAALDPLVTV